MNENTAYCESDCNILHSEHVSRPLEGDVGVLAGEGWPRDGHLLLAAAALPAERAEAVEAGRSIHASPAVASV